MGQDFIRHEGNEIGFLERRGSDWLATSKVDNERMIVSDRSVGITWLSRIWEAYFAHRRKP